MGDMDDDDDEDEDTKELMDAEASGMEPRYSSSSILGDDSRENDDPAWDKEGEGDMEEA